MGEPTFADRLAYLRWLRGRGRLRLETDEELAEALGLSAAWVVKWKAKPTAPNSRDSAKSIDKSEAAEGLTSEWLFDGEGNAPDPERWDEWLAARAAPSWKRVAEQHGLEVATKPARVAEPTPEKKTAAGGKRPRKR